MKITKTVDLNPVLIDSVWYVEWSKDEVSPEDDKVLAAWNRFAGKRCAGKEGTRKYYNSKKHATEVIRDFKKWRKRVEESSKPKRPRAQRA